jgi:hypothetical protein
MAVLVGAVLGGAASPAKAAWGVLDIRRPKVVHAPPDQSWLRDVPERSGAHSKGRVAVFVFAGDDVYQPVRAAVVRTLRRKGLNVTATLQPVDSAAQYREMSSALNVAVYVDGDMSGEGTRQSAHIRLRSGVTGQHIATANFSGPTQKIAEAVGHSLWSRVGPATMRACSSAAKPHRHDRGREPLRIEAGSPLEDGPIAAGPGT